MPTASASPSPVVIRRSTTDDIPACGQICFEAFNAINQAHAFPPDVPSLEVGNAIIGMFFGNPDFYCVVAEVDGKIAGSNCLDERSSIAGVGPITVDPAVQNRRIGRFLMDAVIERAKANQAPGIRLVQAAFHNRSLSLYTRLGFDAREPLSVMQGPAIKRVVPGFHVRPATLADLEPCARLCLKVHGIERSKELSDGISLGVATVVERNGAITAFASMMAFFGFAVAECNADLQALIAHADSFQGPGILVPTRNSELLRWCLDNGLRIVQPMTLMSMGLYNEPAGAFLPSITF